MKIFTRTPLDGLAAHDSVVRTARKRASKVPAAERLAYLDNALSALNRAQYNMGRREEMDPEAVWEAYHQARVALGVVEALMVGADQSL